MLFALLALTLSQTPVLSPAVKEPAPLVVEEPAPLPLQEVQEVAPLSEPPLVDTPLRPEEIPPDVKPPTPVVPHQAEGLDGLTTGLAQAGVGTGIAAVFSASLAVMSIFAAVPVVGTIANVVACVNCAVVPGVVGVVETAVGDGVGKRRGAAIWPVVASYGGCCLLGTAQVLVTLIFASSAVSDVLTGQDPNAIAALTKSPALQISNVVFAILTPVVIGVAPALAYGFTAEDKKPGDPGGFGMPGFLSPNHAGPMSTMPSGSGTSVMRF